MENLLNDIVNGGLTPALMYNLLMCIIVIMVALWLRGWITRYLAFMKFKGSIEISKDVIVREGTSTGFVDFNLEDVTQSNIILKSVDGELKKIIPTKNSNDRDWVIVSRQEEDVEK